MERGGRGFHGHSGQFGERNAGWRQRVADALLKGGVFAVQAGAELGRSAKVGARGEDAEAVIQSRHFGRIGSVRRLTRLADDAEDVLGFQRVNREPSHHARPDRLLRLLRRQGARFARAGLSETRIPMALTARAP